MTEQETWFEQVEHDFGDFLQTRINPDVLRRDESGIPISRELLGEAGKLGLLSASLPVSVGGAGYDLFRWGIMLEAVGYQCEDNAFPLLISLFAAMIHVINDTERDDLIDRYVRPAAQADAFSFGSTATRTGSESYRLNADKMLVTGGMMADTFLVYVRDERDDVIAVLVDRNLPGVTITPVSVMGMRAAGLASLRLDNVNVPAKQVVVSTDGIGHVQRFLNRRRVVLTCGILGRLRALVEQTVLHLEETIRYGQPLTAMQSVQGSVGRLYMGLETSQVVVHNALARLGQGFYEPAWDPCISTAKHYLTERAIDVAETALRLYGGRGYIRANHIERYLCDFLGIIPGAGAQDVQEVNIGNWFISEVQRKQYQQEGGE